MKISNGVPISGVTKTFAIVDKMYSCFIIIVFMKQRCA